MKIPSCLAVAVLLAVQSSGFGIEWRYDEPSIDESLLVAAQRGNAEEAIALIESGADINYQSPFKPDYIGGIDRSFNGHKTPLMLAIEKKHEDLVELLISRGANTNARDQWGLTILDHGVRNGSLETVELLLNHGAAINREPTEEEASPIEGLARFARDGGRFNDWSALHWAAWSNRPEVVELLLNRGADPNATESRGRTPLHSLLIPESLWFVSDNEFMHMAMPADSNIVATNRTPEELGRIRECLELLIEFGANPRAKDELQHSPYFYARSGLPDTDFAEILTDAGAVPTLFDAIALGETATAQQILSETTDLLTVQVGPRNDTILHIAVKSGVLESVELLLDYVVDIDSVNGWKQTAILVAVEDGDSALVSELLRMGAATNVIGSFQGSSFTPFAAAIFSGNFDCIEEFLEQRRAISEHDYLVALVRASYMLKSGDEYRELLVRMLQLQGDASFKNQFGATLLGSLCRERDHELLREVIRRGAGVNETALDLFRPLCAALFEDDIESVRMLLDAGADVNAWGIYGRRPMHIAVERANITAVELLLKYGACINAPDYNGLRPLSYLAPEHAMNLKLHLLGATR